MLPVANLDNIPWLQVFPLTLEFFMPSQDSDYGTVDLRITLVPAYVVRDLLHNDVR